MKSALLLLSLAALGGLIGVSFWAAGHIGIQHSIADLLAQPAAGNNPWLWATLADAYFGFLWFWAWVAYKERRWAARLGWLLAILATGNMAMAVYMLIQLARLPAQATVADLLLRTDARR